MRQRSDRRSGLPAINAAVIASPVYLACHWATYRGLSWQDALNSRLRRRGFVHRVPPSGGSDVRSGKEPRILFAPSLALSQLSRCSPPALSRNWPILNCLAFSPRG